MIKTPKRHYLRNLTLGGITGLICAPVAVYVVAGLDALNASGTGGPIASIVLAIAGFSVGLAALALVAVLLPVKGEAWAGLFLGFIAWLPGIVVIGFTTDIIDTTLGMAAIAGATATFLGLFVLLVSQFLPPDETGALPTGQASLPGRFLCLVHLHNLQGWRYLSEESCWQMSTCVRCDSAGDRQKHDWNVTGGHAELATYEQSVRCGDKRTVY